MNTFNNDLTTEELIEKLFPMSIDDIRDTYYYYISNAFADDKSLLYSFLCTYNHKYEMVAYDRLTTESILHYMRTELQDHNVLFRQLNNPYILIAIRMNYENMLKQRQSQLTDK